MIYVLFLSPVRCLVYRRCTDSMLDMWQTYWGFHTGEQYSSKGLTYTVKAFISTLASLVRKQRLIRAAL